MKIFKMLQEAKGLAQITNRKPAPRPPLLYLMELRSQNQHVSTPKRRLSIETEAVPTPLPIKITHVKDNKSSLHTMMR